MKTVLKIEAHRDGYAISQIRRTITVGQLMSILEDYDDDTEIYLSHDNGYTYGGLSLNDIEEAEIDEDDEEE